MIDAREQKILGEYQLCPKCNGQGLVSKPIHVAGDVNQWSATAVSYICDVCNGAKIIPRPIISNTELDIKL